MPSKKLDPEVVAFIEEMNRKINKEQKSRQKEQPPSAYEFNVLKEKDNILQMLNIYKDFEASVEQFRNYVVRWVYHGAKKKLLQAIDFAIQELQKKILDPEVEGHHEAALLNQAIQQRIKFLEQEKEDMNQVGR